MGFMKNAGSAISGGLVGGPVGAAAGGAMSGGKKNTPPPPDFRGAAQETGQSSREAIEAQTRANRPNISTPWASQNWTQGPDGRWQMQTGFSGPMAGLSDSLQGQAAQAMGQPLDFSGLQRLGSGEDARQQAIDSAYKQATSRLDPMWSQREDANRTRLLNQGLDPGSEAFRGEMSAFGRDRNDSYTSALAAAIGQGTQAGQAIFNQNLLGRQQGMNELLTQRTMPLQQLGMLQQFLAMPGFHASGASMPIDYFGAAQALGNYNLGADQLTKRMWGDVYGGLGQLGGSVGRAFVSRGGGG